MIDTEIASGVSREQSDTTTMVRQIAHELRQPLSTIESIAYYLELILPRSDERARAQVERLQQLVDQSNWIVSNAVNFVQASPAIPQEVVLSELVSLATSECRMDNALRLDMEPEATVRLDPGQAVHLIRNLLMFFRKIATEQAPLCISLNEGRDLTRIRFSTTAVVFAEYDVRLMFEPYSAALPSGSGLSLASVKRIVEAHEGDIEIDVSPATGTTIVLILPR